MPGSLTDAAMAADWRSAAAAAIGEPGDDPERMARLLKQFAANWNYRSAAVEELAIQDDFCRRPLRPEDLGIIDFSKPLHLETLTTLSGLAANRMLLCVNESNQAAPRELLRPERTRRCDAFHGAGSRLLGQLVRPFLERLVFDWIEAAVAYTSAPPERFDALCAGVHNELVERDTILTTLADGTDGEGLLLLQDAGLATTRIAAIQRGRAVAAADSRGADTLGTALLHFATVDWRSLLSRYNLVGYPHAHWQFYLPTSLAATNYLYRVAADPLRWFELQGASAYFVLEMLTALCCRAARGDIRFPRDAGAQWASSLPLQFDEYAAYGDLARRRWLHGFSVARALREARDVDLWNQLVWLTRMESYRELARSIDAKVRRDGIAIDRETFVEPRDMCSTTHVHDDQRLVVIDSGEMVFWGAPGMKLHLGPGEMTLVPRARLHGSSVESPECTYHQPIVPEAWVSGVLRTPPWRNERGWTAGVV